jgi:hypothetical protein
MTRGCRPSAPITIRRACGRRTFRTVSGARPLRLIEASGRVTSASPTRYTGPIAEERRNVRAQLRLDSFDAARRARRVRGAAFGALPVAAFAIVAARHDGVERVAASAR